MDKILNSPAFVIHISKKCPERLSFFKDNIVNAGFKNMIIVEGVDGKNEDDVNNSLSLLNIKNIDSEVSVGQLGCLLSHLKLLRVIVDNKIQISTIFEDDVHFHPNWNTLSDTYYNLTPSNFDILFIGNGLDSCRQMTYNYNISEITNESVWCTHAYIITYNGAKKLLNSLLNWDYRNFIHNSRGNTLNGLYIIDIMIKDIQNKSLKNKRYPFIWYSWNGTKYPCQFNTLPVIGNNARNTGLVFQNADNFKSIVS
jgi:glycosyl transferase family 25